MSPRRRLLNLVAENSLTGVCSLHHINLHSPKNNLFYPTTADAASHYSSCFPELKKMKRIRLGKPRLRFQSALDGNNGYSLLGRLLKCVALSESKTVFLDYQSSGAFLYDDDERCVVTLPNLRRSKYSPICLSKAGTGVSEYGLKEDDNVFVMERSPRPAAEAFPFQFEALVHRKEMGVLSYINRWHCEDLAPPPYVSDAGYSNTMIDSYGLVGGVICVSTKGIGTYCFDTASRTWSKAVDWALPFSGKIEHVPELGLLVGFGVPALEEDHHLCACPVPWTVSAAGPILCHDLGHLEYNWRTERWPQLVSLGSGKFCVVQFFKTMKEACDRCNHEEICKRFAVFTGVEVVRDGKDDDGDEAANIDGEEGIRVIRHKSKAYMLVKYENIIIKSVL